MKSTAPPSSNHHARVQSDHSVHFSADFHDRVTPFAHVWEHTVGSGHALLALRADWQKQIKRCHDELGFGHVRFHGILSDDVGTLTCEDDKLVYSFFNTDQIFDYLVSIGMRPFVELSFMPTALASGSEIVFHYKGNITPPKDYGVWSTFIRKLVEHWLHRYGEGEVRQWNFEVWNEPNLKAFWTGTQPDYFHLYEHTARAIKSIDPHLRVGGPATANNAWIDDLLNFSEAAGVPVDFVSTHHYPTDAFGKPGDNTVQQLQASHRGVLREEARQVRSEARGKPVYYTEWNTSSNPFDDLHDQPYAAAFITKTVMDVKDQVQAYSFWTFSDIFEENYFSSVPFHGGFGLMTMHGIPKPSYRAFQLLHGLGDEWLPVEGHHRTVDCWVTQDLDSAQVLLVNSALPGHPIKAESVKVRLKHVGDAKNMKVQRIDDSHANPRRVWEEMGRPDYLSAETKGALEQASMLQDEDADVRELPGSLEIALELPPQGVACITWKTQF